MMIRSWGIIALLAIPITASANDEARDVDQNRMIAYQYALYLLPGSKGDPVETSTELIRGQYEQYSIIETLDDPPAQPVLALTMITNAQRQYVPPDMQMIGYFGRSVSRKQALAVQESEKVLIFDFAYPARFASTAYYEALTFMEKVSNHHESLIWDEATREIFSPQGWRERRTNTWNDGVPSAQLHTVIHAYQNGEYVRAITLGMEKFGLPDIVVNDFLWSNSRPIGNLINLVTQALIEGADFDDDLSLEIDVSKIKHMEIREDMRAALLDNAKGKIKLYFRPTEPDEGDPANMLLEIRFDSAAGATTQEQQGALLDGLFGRQESVVAVDHNRTILAASQRARKKLPELRHEFEEGLEPGGFIHVKAPFPTPDGGNEWMWVEVIEWNGSRIRGLLRNEPVGIPDLRGGSEVIVDQEDVFDYIRFFPDGQQEGNATGRLIQEYQER